MQHPQLPEITTKLKRYFISLYQEQLEAIILYGSQAREEAQATSDIDILVILKSNINPYQEIDRTSKAIAQLCLEYDVVISRHFVSLDKFQTSNTPFLHNVKQEGIVL